MKPCHRGKQAEVEPFLDPLKGPRHLKATLWSFILLSTSPFPLGQDSLDLSQVKIRMWTLFLTKEVGPGGVSLSAEENNREHLCFCGPVLLVERVSLPLGLCVQVRFGTGQACSSGFPETRLWGQSLWICVKYQVGSITASRRAFCFLHRHYLFNLKIKCAAVCFQDTAF